jgi:hypothetical protein
VYCPIARFGLDLWEPHGDSLVGWFGSSFLRDFGFFMFFTCIDRVTRFRWTFSKCEEHHSVSIRYRLYNGTVSCLIGPSGKRTDTDFRSHAMRWRVAHRTVGYGPLYQGRFKSFPVQSDEHLLTVARYVERNPVAAGLVPRAQEWCWGSLWTRTHGDDAVKGLLSPWPFERPKNWIARVNAPLSGKELQCIQVSLKRGRPFGDDAWVGGKVVELGLKHTVRSEGRPPKTSKQKRTTPGETKN